MPAARSHVGARRSQTVCNPSAIARHGRIIGAAAMPSVRGRRRWGCDTGQARGSG